MPPGAEIIPTDEPETPFYCYDIMSASFSTPTVNDGRDVSLTHEVRVYVGTYYIKVFCLTSQELYNSVEDIFGHKSFVLFFGMKPLSRRDISLDQYGFLFEIPTRVRYDGSFMLLGGAPKKNNGLKKIECPADIINRDGPDPHPVFMPMVQYGVLAFGREYLLREVKGMDKFGYARNKQQYDQQIEEAINMCEIIMLQGENFFQIRNKFELISWIQRTYKMYTHKNWSYIGRDGDKGPMARVCEKFISPLLSKKEIDTDIYGDIVQDSTAEFKNNDDAEAEFFDKMSDKDIGSKSGYTEQSKYTISESMFEDFLKVARNGLTSIEKLEKHPIVKRLTALSSYMLVNGTLASLGIDINEVGYSEIEKTAMKMKYSSKKGYVLCVLDVALFIAERCYQVYKTGQWSSIIHSGATYESWFDKAMDVKRKSLLLSNAKLHGFTIYEFIADIKECIEIGENIVRFPATDCKFEMKNVKQLLHELKNIDASELTKRAAGKSRDAPFASLIVGDSGIGKSGISAIIEHAYTTYFGLPEGEEYVYNLNTEEDHVDGYNTSKHTTIMDDIGARRAGTGDDNSIKYVIAWINDVATITKQADLPDKGRIPFVSEHIIATSNQDDLNAHENYEHPAAILRRFPLVIEAKVKDEYNLNGFLDKKKAVPPSDGSFPNFWNFHVKKFETYFSHKRQMAKCVPVLDDEGEPVVYDNTDDFIKHYLKTAEFHKACLVQKKQAYGNLSKMCKTCMSTMTKCSCITPQIAEDVPTTPEWQTTPRKSWKDTFTAIYTNTMITTIRVWSYCFLECGFGLSFFNFFMNQWLIRYYVWTWVNHFLPAREAIGLMGTMIERRRTSKAVVITLKCLGALSVAYVTYKGFNYVSSKFKGDDGKDDEYPDCELEVAVLKHKCGDSKTEFITVDGKRYFADQGNINVIGKPAIAHGEEKENVWHKVDIRLTPQDVSPKTKSMCGVNQEELVEVLKRNVVRLHIQYDDKKRYSQEALCLKGQKYVANAHAFKTTHPDGTPICTYNITVDLLPTQDGVNQSYFVALTREDMLLDMEHDLALFELSGVPPKKDVTTFLPNEEFNCLVNGVLIGQDFTRKLTKVTTCWSPPGMNTNCKMISYDCQEVTQFGDCGAMIMAYTPRGPVVMGFHAYLKNNSTQSFGIFLTKEYVDRLLEEFQPQSMTLVDFEPNTIALDLEEGDRTIGPIHPKSVITYVEEGVANVYGTVSGFRNRPRSKVCNTPKKSQIELLYGKTSEYGKPVMSGWNYLRKNFLPLVQKKSTFKRSVLIKARDGFIKDIKSGLDAVHPDWKNDLHALDNYSTVNGQPGVRFIDGLNFNSSMGNPFNKSKKNFIHDDPRENYPNGRNFDQTVWDRVQKMEDCYQNRQRYMPVFNVHPKDEATANSKIADEKTRLFMCGPIDYSLYTRKHLLTFVRLVQNNRFIFESGPGTICQSLEWEQIRDFLCVHGEDRIVAGDYKQFDKGMLADFMLSAYYIIAQLFKESGADEETINSICGIMYDTCFPVTNFNGDIIEFFGSNPSGHPLTVIINGLVNALYVRYCYILANPDHECDTFKQNVNLMTYGDDNIMGISHNCPWFHHTAIQKHLGEIGIAYTMSDKVSQSIPYVHIDSESFLKRMWRYDELLDVYVCPLDEESIFKSLTVWVPSESIAPEAQFTAVVQSAMYEYFYYGEKKFNKMRKALQDICYADDNIVPYIADSTFPTWEMLYEHFVASSRGLTTLRHPNGLNSAIAAQV